MSKHQIELGDEVQDVVTHTQGIAVCHCEWLHGCIRWVIQPPMGKDGKVPDSTSHDEPALKIIKKGKVKRPEAALAPVAPPGGPKPIPSRNEVP